MSVYPYGAFQTADYRVILDIQRFDSEGQQTAIIDALWSIQTAQKNARTNTGHSVVREPTEDTSYKALASAHSRALATLSHDIAEALHSVGSPAR